jgi:ArsR family transcriptional regulator
MKNRKKYEARARIIKAMAHPTRLCIVDELSKGKMCVNELTSIIGADMSTVSKHLAVLKNAGIINSNKQGANVYYILKMPCMLGFFSCVETVLKTTAKEQMKLSR